MYLARTTVELPILLQSENNLTRLDVKCVQYVPRISDLIISCHAFNEQFEISFILNINDGFILLRKLKRKLTMHQTRNGIYHVNLLPETNYHVMSLSVNNVTLRCNKLVRRNELRLQKRILSLQKLEALRKEGNLSHRLTNIQCIRRLRSSFDVCSWRSKCTNFHCYNSQLSNVCES